MGFEVSMGSQRFTYVTATAMLCGQLYRFEVMDVIYDGRKGIIDIRIPSAVEDLDTYRD